MRIIAYNTDSSHNIQTLIYFNIVTSWLHAKSQGIRIRMKLLHDVLKLLVVSDPLWCTWFRRFSKLGRLVSLTSVSACSAFKASRTFQPLAMLEERGRSAGLVHVPHLMAEGRLGGRGPSNVGRTRKKCQAGLVHVLHLMAEGRLSGRSLIACVFKLGGGGRHVCLGRRGFTVL